MEVTKTKSEFRRLKSNMESIKTTREDLVRLSKATLGAPKEKLKKKSWGSEA